MFDNTPSKIPLRTYIISNEQTLTRIVIIITWQNEKQILLLTYYKCDLQLKNREDICSNEFQESTFLSNEDESFGYFKATTGFRGYKFAKMKIVVNKIKTEASEFKGFKVRHKTMSEG